MKKLADIDFKTFYEVNEYVAKTTPMRTHYNSLSKFERWLWAEKKRIIKKFLDTITYKNLIDVGCGDGGLYQLTNTDSHYTGIDISPTQLAYFRKHIPKSRQKSTTLRKGDISKMPFTSNSFDVALVCDVLEHVLDPIKVLTEIHRIIKPNGYVLMSIPNEYVMQCARLLTMRFPLRSPDHIYALTVGDIQKVLPGILAVKSIPFVVLPAINVMSIVLAKNEK